MYYNVGAHHRRRGGVVAALVHLRRRLLLVLVSNTISIVSISISIVISDIIMIKIINIIMN